MARAHRNLLTALLGLVPALLLAAGPAHAGIGLRFLDVYRWAAGYDGMYGPFGLVLSPDGKYLYVAAEGSDAIETFARGAATGSLAFLESTRTPYYFAEKGRHSPRGVAVSPDGAQLYVVSRDGDALMVYARDTASGGLTLLQIVDDAVAGVNGLKGAEEVVVSPDGAHVYVAGRRDNAVAVFGREADTGFVTFIEMKRDGVDGVRGIAGARALGLSPDGAHLYVAGSEANAVAVFARDPGSGVLTFRGALYDGVDGVDGLDKAQGVTVTPDGAHVLVAGGGEDKIVVFRRDVGTGALTFVEVHQDGVDGVNGINGASDIAVSPDGSRVYVTGSVDNALAVFHRDAGTGALTYIERKRDGLAGVDGLGGAQAVVVGGDGTTVYTTGVADNAVAAFRLTTCGDGFVDTDEQCDDGNAADGDCCSSTCQERAADGAPCNDGAFCTVNASCSAGICRGTPRDCSSAATDQCHQGVCDEAANRCVSQPKTDGSVCDDGDPCTRSDTCIAAVCTAADPVVCTAQDQCHEAGVCDPATGMCSDPAKPDGTACDDGSGGSEHDVCTAGVCEEHPLADRDGDGIADTVDLCPGIPDPGQRDDDHDGVGDACECSAPAPGRCIAGGGPAATDCLLELNPFGPVTLNARHTKVKGVLRCTDGDPACDRDGRADGRCTFGVAVCLANADPRLARCQPTAVTDLEVLAPDAGAKSALDRANAHAFETTAAAIGLDIRRQGRFFTAATGRRGHDVCSALANLAVPAPAPGGKPVRRTFRLRARAANGRTDVDAFSVECRR